MTSRERVRRAIEFDNPDCVPLSEGFSYATWRKYREILKPLAKRLEGDFGFGPDEGPKDYDAFPPCYRKGERFTDNWGCIWNCLIDGLEGIIEHHPLADWSNLDNYKAPDPIKMEERGPRDLEGFAEQIRKYGHKKFIWAYGERFWERVHFVRGYENTLSDLAIGEPRLVKLIDMILEHNLKLVDALVKMYVDGIIFGDDWGDQERLMISPYMWRKYFKAGYQEMFNRCKKAGKFVYFHTDGHLLPIIEDLIEIGVDVLNLQSGANGIDNISMLCRGKVCVAIDLDRQKILPFGTPQDVKNHVIECVEKLSNENGGVIIKPAIYPDVPLKNIEALAEVMEELRATASV